MSRPQKYPWHHWLDRSTGVTHVDLRDWDVKRQSLQVQIVTRAKKEGLRVSTGRCPQHHHECLRIKLHGQDRRRYDWDRLLDGRPHALTHDEFETWESFVRGARRAAASRRLLVRTAKDRLGGWVEAREKEPHWSQDPPLEWSEGDTRHPWPELEAQKTQVLLTSEGQVPSSDPGGQ